MKFIAEFCQNHNGDFEVLKEMIYAAKESGADYAKIQTIFANMVSYRERFEEGIMKNGEIIAIKRPYQLEFDRLKRLEISYDQQSQFIEICENVGIKPLTTAFTRDSVHRIKEIGFKEVKIASYDCASPPLLREVKEAFDKIYLSTGATYDDEIEAAAKILDGSDFSLLHCVTMYPTPLDEFHLARMKYLRKFSSSVGWSDHSLIERDGILGTLASVYYGADVIERHFTILPADQTKDGPISVRPEHIKELKTFEALSKEDQLIALQEKLPNFERTLGKVERTLSKAELLNRDYFRGRFASKVSGDQIVFNWE
jgi:N,N'-diacetyllegionaminate synthase